MAHKRGRAYRRWQRAKRPWETRPPKDRWRFRPWYFCMFGRECDWCAGGRLFQRRRVDAAAAEELLSFWMSGDGA